MCDYYLHTARRAERRITPHRAFPHYPTLFTEKLPRFTGFDEALNWLDRERATLLALAQLAYRFGLYETSWHLADVSWPLLLHKDYPDLRLRFDWVGVRAGQAWGHPWGEEMMRKRLAQEWTRRGRYPAAREQLAILLQRDHDAGDSRKVADTLGDLAQVYLAAGDFATAIRALSELLSRYRALDLPHQVADTLRTLGQIHLAEAARMFREAREAFVDTRVADADSAKISEALDLLLSGPADNAPAHP